MTTLQQFGRRCPRCLDTIYSNSRYDLEWCACGWLFIDGGFEEPRYGSMDDSGSARAALRVERLVTKETLPVRYDQEEGRGLPPSP